MRHRDTADVLDEKFVVDDGALESNPGLHGVPSLARPTTTPLWPPCTTVTGRGIDGNRNAGLAALLVFNSTMVAEYQSYYRGWKVSACPGGFAYRPDPDATTCGSTCTDKESRRSLEHPGTCPTVSPVSTHSSSTGVLKDFPSRYGLLPTTEAERPVTSCGPVGAR